MLVRGYDYSISVTGAIAIVLYALLDVEGGLASGWSDFEVLAALNEIQYMTLDLDREYLKEFGVQLLTLKSAFPAPNASKNFKVPVMYRNAVIVNGPNAKFADIIAPYHMGQCKFTNDTSNAVKVNISEFTKMGIMKPDSAHDDTFVSGALLSALFHGWRQNKPLRNLGLESRILVNSLFGLSQEIQNFNRQFHPGGQLLGETKRYFGEFLNYTFNETERRLYNEDGDSFVDANTPIHGVQAVFYTNGAEFIIKNGNRSTSVRRNDFDVDINGLISEAKQSDILNVLNMSLRDGVELVFLFAADYDP